MVVVDMYHEGDKYVYELSGHLDPKQWQVEVKNGRLYVFADEEWGENESGQTKTIRHAWDTKLSRYCKSNDFTLVRTAQRHGTRLLVR